MQDVENYTYEAAGWRWINGLDEYRMPTRFQRLPEQKTDRVWLIPLMNLLIIFAKMKIELAPDE